MCGRGSLTKVESELEQRFDATFYSEDLERYQPLPSFNIAPTHWHPVVPQDDSKHFRYFKWGLIPFWAKDAKIGSKMINARIETLTVKPSYRTALESRRCIVPMDGFYEWKKGEGRRKQPFRVGVRGGGVFFMAGLYDHWKDPATSQLISSFTIITMPANPFMESIHDRMPAMLLPEEESHWIQPDLTSDQALKLLQPYPDELMSAYPVSDAVNSVQHNDPSLILPV